MSYNQLTSIERGKLEAFFKLGFSTRQIGAYLGRHHSSIAREFKRNSPTGEYYAKNADISSRNRRANTSGNSTKFTTGLVKLIEEKLKATWSPEQIANTVVKGQICCKSIYRWIYEGKVAAGDLKTLRHKGKRRRPAEKRGVFSNGVSIHERSQAANERSEFGHWELDTVVSGGGSKGCFSTFVERKSRLYVAYIGNDRTSQTMEKAISKLFEALPQGAFKSATTDRGKEFACHMNIKQHLNIPVYFADAYSPWQRGSNENSNGLIREFYPKRTDLGKVTQSELRHALELINHRPRKCLGWRSAIQAFLQEVSHLD